jgi:uncharacterized DUF497 family protein
MDILFQLEGFEWDQSNIEKNWEKHRVSYLECEEVFFNQPLLVQEDEIHSKFEPRYYVLGRSNDGRHLFIVFTIRRNKIRVISARNMSRRERRIYREQIEKSSKIQE